MGFKTVKLTHIHVSTQKQWSHVSFKILLQSFVALLLIFIAKLDL